VEISDESEMPATLHLAGTPITANDVVSSLQGCVLFKPRVQVVLEEVLDPCCVVVWVCCDAHVHHNDLRGEMILS